MTTTEASPSFRLDGQVALVTGAAAVVTGATLYIVNRPTQAEGRVAFSFVPLEGGGHLQLVGRY